MNLEPMSKQPLGLWWLHLCTYQKSCDLLCISDDGLEELSYQRVLPGSKWIIMSELLWNLGTECSFSSTVICRPIVLLRPRAFCKYCTECIMREIGFHYSFCIFFSCGSCEAWIMWTIFCHILNLKWMTISTADWKVKRSCLDATKRYWIESNYLRLALLWKPN